MSGNAGHDCESLGHWQRTVPPHDGWPPQTPERGDVFASLRKTDSSSVRSDDGDRVKLWDSA